MTIKGTVNLNIFGLFMKDVIVYDVYFTPIILVNKVAEDKKTHTSWRSQCTDAAIKA